MYTELGYNVKVARQKKIIAIGDKVREELELKESDVNNAIKKVRQKNANRR